MSPSARVWLAAAMAACFAAGVVAGRRAAQGGATAAAAPAPAPALAPAPAPALAPAPAPAAASAPAAAKAPAAPAVLDEASLAVLPAYEPAQSPLASMLLRSLDAASPQFQAFASRIKQAWLEACADTRYPARDFYELYFDPAPLAGRGLTLFGMFSQVSLGEARPYAMLSDRWGAQPLLPVLLDKLSARQQSALERAARRPRAFRVRGTLRRTAKGGWYVEPDHIDLLGEVPLGFQDGLRACVFPAARLDDRAATGARAQAAAAAFRADASLRFVELGELVLRPEKLAGKRVGVLGVPNEFQLSSAGPFERLVPFFGSASGIDVLLARVDRKRQLELLQEEFPPRLLSVRGTVKQAANGAYYIDADDVAILGKADSVPGVFAP